MSWIWLSLYFVGRGGTEGTLTHLRTEFNKKLILGVSGLYNQKKKFLC